MPSHRLLLLGQIDDAHSPFAENVHQAVSTDPPAELLYHGIRGTFAVATALDVFIGKAEGEQPVELVRFSAEC